MFIFQNIEFFPKCIKEIKNSCGVWKINKFIWNEMDRLLDYSLGNYIFYHFVNNISALLLSKINIFEIFNLVDFFFRFLLYRDVMKFWAN